MYIVLIIVASIGMMIFLTTISAGFNICTFSSLILVLPCIFATIHNHKQKKQEEEERRTAEREAAEQRRLAEEQAEKERKLAEEAAERLKRESEELKRKAEGSKKRFEEIKQRICGRLFDILKSNNVNIDQHLIFIFEGYINEDACNDLWIKLWLKNITDNLSDQYKAAIDEITSKYRAELDAYNNAPRLIEEMESQNEECYERKRKVNQDIQNCIRESLNNPRSRYSYDSLISQGQYLIKTLDKALKLGNEIIEENKALLRNTDLNALSEKYKRKLAEISVYYNNQLELVKKAFELLRSEFKEVENLDLDGIMSRMKYTYKDWIFNKSPNNDEVFSIAEGRYIYIGDTFPKNNSYNSKPLYTWDGDRMYNGDGSEKNVLYTIKGRYVYKGEDTEGTPVYTLV